MDTRSGQKKRKLNGRKEKDGKAEEGEVAKSTEWCALYTCDLHHWAVDSRKPSMGSRVWRISFWVIVNKGNQEVILG
jgi:hypothetical protein